MLFLLAASCTPGDTVPGKAQPKASGANSQASDSPIRAVWITRWDYKTESDVRTIIANCAEAGFNQLMFQVRGNASVFFPSSYEPWAEQFDWTDPGFDPLGLALREAHARGMELHAWANVVPAWYGNQQPQGQAHVLHQHPEWFWYDQFGDLQPASEKFYLSLNPCLPAVQSHIRSVLGELVEGYAIDGLHLDYIRFPNEPPAVREGSDYPRDAQTLALYREATGLHPDDNPEHWDQWRSDQITALLAGIRETALAARPGLEISAAVGSEAPRALEHFQDWATWIERGLVDVLYPMNYTGDDERYAARVEDWTGRAERVSVVMGLHAMNSTPAVLKARMAQAETLFQGSSLFGYAYFWSSAGDKPEDLTAELLQGREQLRTLLLPLPSK